MTLPTFAAECVTAINSMPAGRHCCCQSMRQTEWTGGHPTLLRAASIRDSVITAGSYLREYMMADDDSLSLT